jgi:hypothetical protein
LDFLSLKNYVNVPSKLNKKINLNKKKIFGRPEGLMTKIAGSGSESGSGSISQRHGSADPDPDPDPHPKCHGSGTLFF